MTDNPLATARGIADGIVNEAHHLGSVCIQRDAHRLLDAIRGAVIATEYIEQHGDQRAVNIAKAIRRAMAEALAGEG